jgi:hypothetical protein
MAKEDERRKKYWQDEEEEIASPKPESSEDIDRKIQEARVLMEQTHQLYQHYFNGLEKRIPIEKIKLLESKIAELNRIGTNLTVARFKVRQFVIQYMTMNELWARKLRDFERK